MTSTWLIPSFILAYAGVLLLLVSLVEEDPQKGIDMRQIGARLIFLALLWPLAAVWAIGFGLVWLWRQTGWLKRKDD